MEVTGKASPKLTEVCSITTGTVFTCDRTNSYEGTGYYMKIDGSSGLIKDVINGRSSYKYAFAVNLETAQLRRFNSTYEVQPVNAKVILE